MRREDFEDRPCNLLRFYVPIISEMVTNGSQKFGFMAHFVRFSRWSPALIIHTANEHRQLGAELRSLLWGVATSFLHS
jgi:hypothetical protein